MVRKKFSMGSRSWKVNVDNAGGKPRKYSSRIADEINQVWGDQISQTEKAYWEKEIREDNPKNTKRRGPKKKRRKPKKPPTPQRPSAKQPKPWWLEPKPIDPYQSMGDLAQEKIEAESVIDISVDVALDLDVTGDEQEPTVDETPQLIPPCESISDDIVTSDEIVTTSALFVPNLSGEQKARMDARTEKESAISQKQRERDKARLAFIKENEDKQTERVKDRQERRAKPKRPRKPKSPITDAMAQAEPGSKEYYKQMLLGVSDDDANIDYWLLTTDY